MSLPTSSIIDTWRHQMFPTLAAAEIERLPAKTNGTAQSTIDIREPGMLTVVVAHPPRFGGKVVSIDADQARTVPGVVDVKQIPTGL